MENLKTHRFDTWLEFMENSKHGKPNPNCSKEDGDTVSSRRDEWAQTKPWSGAHSYEEALNFLYKGWKDGLNRLRNFQRGIPPDLFDCIMPVKDYKPELRHDIAGGAVDVAAHITGATPETFITEKPPIDETGNQIITGRRLQTVYMNISNSSSMNEEAFFYRGAYTFTMIEHMENCGYSVELWVVNNVTGTNNVHQLSYVKVKEFGELFDTNKLVVSLCSNFMLRRFMFAIQEQGDDEEIESIQSYAYGMPEKGTVDSIALPEDMDLNPIYINSVNQSSPEAMLAEFKHILEKFANPDTFVE